jgi:Ni,Fe-hydrogenase III small subunit
VDQIFQKDEVWDAKDTPRKDIISFLDSMTQKQFEQVQQFFETMPILQHKFTVTNPNTGVQSNFVLEGLQSFFA